MKEVFTLILSNQLDLTTNGFALNATNKASVLYQVDFGALFNGKDKMYKKCQLRMALMTNNLSASSIALSTGSILITGLASGNDLGVNGLFVANYAPSNATASGSGSTGYYLPTNTLLNTNGTQMNQIPTGIRQFNVNFLNLSGALQPTANIPDYRMVLQFELYEPVV
jgi:hypothetical protein